MPMPCEQQQRLLRAFAAAVSDYNRIHGEQVHAVMNGENFPFEEEIARASAERHRLKEAIIQHRRAHGC